MPIKEKKSISKKREQPLKLDTNFEGVFKVVKAYKEKKMKEGKKSS